MAENKTCSLCEEKALVHVSYVVGGKLNAVHYCEQHAYQAGVFDSGAYSLVTHPEQDDTSGPVCPGCGYTRKHWRHTGRLGCAVCYETFRDEISKMLPKMHRGVNHVGRVPRSRVSPVWVDHRLDYLNRQLAQAVREERYEDAAELRDEIQNLKSSLGAGC